MRKGPAPASHLNWGNKESWIFYRVEGKKRGRLTSPDPAEKEGKSQLLNRGSTRLSPSSVHGGKEWEKKGENSSLLSQRRELFTIPFIVWKGRASLVSPETKIKEKGKKVKGEKEVYCLFRPGAEGFLS